MYSNRTSIHFSPSANASDAFCASPFFPSFATAWIYTDPSSKYLPWPSQQILKPAIPHRASLPLSLCKANFEAQQLRNSTRIALIQERPGRLKGKKKSRTWKVS